MQLISSEFNKFIKDNQELAGVAKGSKDSKPTKDIGALVRAAPQYLEQLSKVTRPFGLDRAELNCADPFDLLALVYASHQSHPGLHEEVHWGEDRGPRRL